MVRTIDNVASRLRGYLAQYAKEYPGAWKRYEEFRNGKGKDLPNWPDWCWCPLAASYAIVSGGGNNRVPFDKIPDVSILGALASWRMTQGIYRYDSDVFAELWSTPLTGEIPIDVLFYLPEWCVYVEAPAGYKLGAYSIKGWFVHLEYDVGTGRSELRFVFDLDRRLWPFVLHLDALSLSDCIRNVIIESERQIGDQNIVYSDKLSENDIVRFSAALSPIVSVVLYLCSIATDAEDADISDLHGKRERPGNPVPKKTKRGMRTFPLSGTTWLIGYRMGASLRLARPRHDNVSSADSKSSVSRASPCPHIRRAHWHTYWTGPTNEPKKRKTVLKWLPPTLVGVGDIVPTIRSID